jgi:hypothetical protein
MGCNCIPSQLTKPPKNLGVYSCLDWLYNKTNFKWLYGWVSVVTDFEEYQEPAKEGQHGIEEGNHVIKFKVNHTVQQVFVNGRNHVTGQELFETTALWRLENFNVEAFMSEWLWNKTKSLVDDAFECRKVPNFPIGGVHARYPIDVENPVFVSSQVP